jgi:uncharacterized protein (UPF0276 family)
LIAVGFTLQPDPEFLDLLDPLLRDGPDYFEVAPETTWRERPDGTLVENGYARRFLVLGEETQKPFVAHGVGFSVASGEEDETRQRRWLDRLALDQERFRYRWLTDHLGLSSPAGLNGMLPLPFPWTDTYAARVRWALSRLQRVVPDVGVENSVPYFSPDAPLDEPTFLRRALVAPRTHLLLDLHNLWTVALHHDFDPGDYLARLDLTRVIEIHVSGGSESQPGWLPGGRTMRLDSHDSAVPDEVFRLLERVLPGCPNLRGVTLERMEGTVQSADLPLLRRELRTIRRMTEKTLLPAPPPSARKGEGGQGGEVPSVDAPFKLPPRPERERGAGGGEVYERSLLRSLVSLDPLAALAAERDDPALPDEVRAWLGAIDGDGFRMAALLVARLRFERLTRGSPEADAWFEDSPEAFAAAFRAYHQEVTPEAYFPGSEARIFAAWCRVREEKRA